MTYTNLPSIDQLIVMEKHGMTIKAIAKKYNATYMQVYGRLNPGKHKKHNDKTRALGLKTVSGKQRTYPLTVRLPLDFYWRLEELSKEQSRSLSEIARSLIETGYTQHMENPE